MHTDRVERIALQLVFMLHELEDVELQAAIEDCLPGITLTISLRREVSVFHLRLDALAAGRVSFETNRTRPDKAWTYLLISQDRGIWELLGVELCQ